jgi:hypothetical protein
MTVKPFIAIFATGLIWASTLATAQESTTRAAHSRPATRATSEPTSLPGEPLAPADEKALQDLLAKMREATAKGDEEALAAFMTPEEGKIAKPVLASDGVMRAKVASLLEAAKAKGIALPAEYPDQKFLGLLPTGKVTFRRMTTEYAQGFAEPAKPVMFRNADGQWKYTIESKKKKKQAEVDLAIEVLNAIAKSVEELTAGIKDGSITNENLDQKNAEIGKRVVAPVMNKLIEETMSGAAETQP